MSQNSDGAVVANWGASDGATRYRLQWIMVSGSNDRGIECTHDGMSVTTVSLTGERINQATVAGTSYTVGSLSPGWWYFHVIAVNDRGFSSECCAPTYLNVMATPTPTPTPAPTPDDDDDGGGGGAPPVVKQPTPEPPTVKPTVEEPTPEPEEPTVAPVEKDDPTATPTPSATPTATPEPTATYTPTPTPTPTPTATATPTPTPSPTPTPVPTATPTPTPTPTPEVVETGTADLQEPGVPIIGNAIPRIRDTLINLVTTPRQRNTLIIILGIVGLLVIIIFAYLVWRRR